MCNYTISYICRDNTYDDRGQFEWLYPDFNSKKLRDRTKVEGERWLFGVSRSLTPCYNSHTHIWIERAESRSVSRDRIWIIQKSGIGISKKSRKGGRILLILPRKTENPNRIISKTRKTKIEPYQSRVDFARISITSEWTLILFLGFMKRIADSSPLRANTLISKRSIASFINEKP